MLCNGVESFMQNPLVRGTTYMYAAQKKLSFSKLDYENCLCIFLEHTMVKHLQRLMTANTQAILYKHLHMQDVHTEMESQAIDLHVTIIGVMNIK